MKSIYSLSLLSVVFLFLSVTKSTFKLSDKESFNVAILSESELIIKGKTNVNTFQCSYDITNISDPLQVNFTEENNSIEFSESLMTLKNISFDCGNKGINKDFNRLLDTDKFPSIAISLLSVSKTKSQEDVFAEIEVIICEITKVYSIPINVNKDKTIIISGNLPIDINDFNLEPPKKVLGMIKVSNEIEIDFHLKVVKC